MAKKKAETQAPVAPAAPAAPAENNSVPVSSASAPVQLTPIIQPIAFVPYSTQNQDLYMYDDVQEDEYEEEYYEEVAAPVAAPKKKKASGAAIALIILSLVLVAVYVIGKFAVQEYLAFIGGVSGLDMILNLVDEFAAGFSMELILPIAVAACGVFAILTLIASLIRVMKKGACVFAKITTFLGLVCALVALIMALMDDMAIGYGLYAAAAISLINVLIAYLAKND